MKPSIGRIVHYYPHDGDRFGETGEPIAAVVVRVWTDECVNLRLLTDTTDTPWITSVRYDESHAECSWSWPPRA